MRKTIKDVAAAAGVSFKTVSRVINNEASVSAEKRARVEQAIADLNFRPSYAARALSGRRSFQIALIYDNPSPYYIHQTHEGVRARCAEAGVRLIIHPCDVGSASLARDIDGLINETHVDGAVLSPPVTESRVVLDVLHRRRIPVVRIAPGLDPDSTPSVAMDDVGAMDEMVSHLIAVGHRRIGFIIGDPHHVASGQRHEGYLRALARAGLPEDPALVRQGFFSFESGVEAARALLAERPRPTAIAASNDDMAAGVLSVAHAAGIAVPGDLSVTGFDDTEVARMVWPQLTTVRQPIRDLAFAAADILVAGAAGEGRRMLRHRLLLRSSTGPAG